MLRQRAMVSCDQTSQLPVDVSAVDTESGSEMDVLSMELSRVVAERDALVAQIKLDAVTMSDRIQQATQQGLVPSSLALKALSWPLGLGIFFAHKLVGGGHFLTSDLNCPFTGCTLYSVISAAA